MVGLGFRVASDLFWGEFNFCFFLSFYLIVCLGD